MGGSGVDRLCHTSGRAVAAAVVGRAQVRAALHHLAGDRGDVAGITALFPLAAARVRRRAAAMDGGVRVGLVPVAGPLPDVADHVDQAVAVWWEGAYRRGPLVAVLLICG